MKVYQIRIKLYLLQDITVNQMQTKLTAFIDKGFACDEQLLQIHRESKYKGYCYDLPYAIERDKMYKKGKVYTVTIRTISTKLAKYFSEICVNQYTKEIKGLTAEVRIIPKKTIETLYTLTPVILKDENGYWKKCMSLEKFEERLKTAFFLLTSFYYLLV